MKKLYFVLIGLFVFGSVNAQIINIPDPVFKAKLLTASSSHVAMDLSGNYFKVDSNNDGEIQVSEALQVSYLNVNNSSFLTHISDLTGIEYFTNLYYLDCSFNYLISSINVSGFINLQTLTCDFNQLSSLDVSGLTNLIELDCENNQLSSLDVSGLTNLLLLRCDRNQITSLNLGGLTNLNFLQCTNNLLQNLDANDLTNIQTINCVNNHLTSLYVKNGSNENLYFVGNPNLSYICADASEIVSVQQNVAQNGYTCTVDSSCALSTNEFQNQKAFSVYPNPTKNNLILEYNIEQNIQSISIYNTLGQVMLVTSNPSKTVDVSNLTTGSYFIKVITDKGTSSGKFIKE